MAIGEIHVGDIGTMFVGNAKKQDGTIQPLNEATDMQLVFTKPNRERVVKVPELLNDGSDGKVIYRTIEGDLDKAGTWKVQFHVVIPDDGAWSSDIYSFDVIPNL